MSNNAVVNCTCDPEEVCDDCGSVGSRVLEKSDIIRQGVTSIPNIDDHNPFKIAQSLIKKRQLTGNRMGINDDLCNTNLISKNYSPMFIRKYNLTGLNNWPLYVSMIVDEDISDIDKVVNGAIRAYEEAGLITNNLQSMRNLTGIVSETLNKYYNYKKENCVEGIAITLYIDKAYIQNFSGDYMNHFSVREEYTAALNMMTQI